MDRAWMAAMVSSSVTVSANSSLSERSARVCGSSLSSGPSSASLAPAICVVSSGMASSFDAESVAAVSFVEVSLEALRLVVEMSGPLDAVPALNWANWGSVGSWSVGRVSVVGDLVGGGGVVGVAVGDVVAGGFVWVLAADVFTSSMYRTIVPS